MPWKECNQMDERLKFIARLLDGEKMAVLCRQFAALSSLRHCSQQSPLPCHDLLRAALRFLPLI